MPSVLPAAIYFLVPVLAIVLAVFVLCVSLARPGLQALLAYTSIAALAIVATVTGALRVARIAQAEPLTQALLVLLLGIPVLHIPGTYTGRSLKLAHISLLAATLSNATALTFLVYFLPSAVPASAAPLSALVFSLLALLRLSPPLYQALRPAAASHPITLQFNSSVWSATTVHLSSPVIAADQEHGSTSSQPAHPKSPSISSISTITALEHGQCVGHNIPVHPRNFYPSLPPSTAHLVSARRLASLQLFQSRSRRLLFFLFISQLQLLAAHTLSLSVAFGQVSETANDAISLFHSILIVAAISFAMTASMLHAFNTSSSLDRSPSSSSSQSSSGRFFAEPSLRSQSQRKSRPTSFTCAPPDIKPMSLPFDQESLPVVVRLAPPPARRKKLPDGRTSHMRRAASITKPRILDEMTASMAIQEVPRERERLLSTVLEQPTTPFPRSHPSEPDSSLASSHRRLSMRNTGPTSPVPTAHVTYLDGWERGGEATGRLEKETLAISPTHRHLRSGPDHFPTWTCMKRSSSFGLRQGASTLLDSSSSSADEMDTKYIGSTIGESYSDAWGSSNTGSDHAKSLAEHEAMKRGAAGQRKPEGLIHSQGRTSGVGEREMGGLISVEIMGSGKSEGFENLGDFSQPLPLTFTTTPALVRAPSSNCGSGESVAATSDTASHLSIRTRDAMLSKFRRSFQGPPRPLPEFSVDDNDTLAEEKKPSRSWLGKTMHPGLSLGFGKKESLPPSEEKRRRMFKRFSEPVRGWRARRSEDLPRRPMMNSNLSDDNHQTFPLETMPSSLLHPLSNIKDASRLTSLSPSMWTSSHPIAERVEFPCSASAESSEEIHEDIEFAIERGFGAFGGERVRRMGDVWGSGFGRSKSVPSTPPFKTRALVSSPTPSLRGKDLIPSRPSTPSSKSRSVVGSPVASPPSSPKARNSLKKQRSVKERLQNNWAPQSSADLFEDSMDRRIPGLQETTVSLSPLRMLSPNPASTSASNTPRLSRLPMMDSVRSALAGVTRMTRVSPHPGVHSPTTESSCGRVSMDVSISGTPFLGVLDIEEEGDFTDLRDPFASPVVFGALRRKTEEEKVSSPDPVREESAGVGRVGKRMNSWGRLPLSRGSILSRSGSKHQRKSVIAKGPGGLVRRRSSKRKKLVGRSARRDTGSFSGDEEEEVWSVDLEEAMLAQRLLQRLEESA